MNMWQIENLTQHQEKCEHQIKDKFNEKHFLLLNMFYWIKRKCGVWSHEQKLEALKRFL